MYASILGICPQKTRTPRAPGGSPVSDALHLDVFDQPAEQVFISDLLEAHF